MPRVITPCITLIDKNLTSFCLLLLLVPTIIYLTTSYVPGGVYSVYQGNTLPSQDVYNRYTQGNFSCSLPIQPWYYAPSTTPLVVLGYGSRVKELLEGAFRIKAGSSRGDLLTQHYLYIQVSTLKEVFELSPPPKKVLYLYSTPVRDFTDYSYRKELHGSGSVKTFVSDWEYTHYVTQHAQAQFYPVNITTFTSKDLVELLYVSLPYLPYHPKETYTSCITSGASQETTFLHRCSTYLKGFSTLFQAASTGELRGTMRGGEEEEEKCKLFT